MQDREDRKKGARYRLGARLLVFVVLVGICGWYSKTLQRQWTSVFPLVCADAPSFPPAVDFEAFPARIGPQENLCDHVGDGSCRRKSATDDVRGECRNGRMDGDFEVKDAESGALRWSGHYRDGWPQGTLKIREDSGHYNEFRIEHLHLDGPITIWERDGARSVELTGRYERGKRVGRWARRVEGKGAIRSALVYDENGLASKEYFYCTNGNMKEVRDELTFFYDAQGKLLDEGSACALP